MANLENENEKNREEQRMKDEKALEELKFSLKDQIAYSGSPNMIRTPSGASEQGGLMTLQEHKEFMDKQMGLDGSAEEENAAKVIQNKFRSMKIVKANNANHQNFENHDGQKHKPGHEPAPTPIKGTESDSGEYHQWEIKLCPP